jgi:hypothetical protein
MGLLDVDIRSIVGAALTDILLDLTYTPPSTGGTMVGGAWVGATAGSARTCKGLVDADVHSLLPDPTTRKAKHRRVLITQTSLAVTPEPGGKVTARSLALTVLQVSQDPAGATWELLAEV